MLRALKADITTLEVDAIVTAANAALRGGGGVDGAVHRAAGPELLAACRRLGGCPTGEARITPGFRLKARHVIHAVGPVWQGGGAGEAALLAGCYRAALALLHGVGGRSIAFPAISTGVYGYPAEAACAIAVATLREALAAHASVDIILACFDDRTLALYEKELAT
ncbi:macro domain-containing protein [Siccirubricoccus deserti]|uniref:O-acetyl-ADP-ribose deacetylase n=1 Tax=Siccirubricoccus deserti TaxID=2013562 RepID=A0A9X0QYQ0_9PROT|nr:O-acetyl-ADP-ribose deacetylase [Siccirubricoccus deserti]MBC4016309.1 O-acetyl-ADP-ribose deacetylase [Siccirubricoccus deserti]GGC46935.1 macro domain-containing protein [Siccirubricoccus deserti]